MSIKQSIFDGVIFAYLILVALIFLGFWSSSQGVEVTTASLAFFIFLALGILGAYALNKGGVQTLGAKVFAPPSKKGGGAGLVEPWYKTFSGWQFFLAFVVTFVTGLITTEVSITDLVDIEGLTGAGRIFSSLFNPNFSILPAAILKMVSTIYMAFMATILAIPISFILGFAAAKNIMKSPFGIVIYTSLRTVLNVSRSIEPVIWAVIFSIWVGAGAFAGMLALMIHSIASLAKQYSEIVESISDGPVEGIESTGASRLQVIWFAIVPQVVLPFISYTIYRWDINVRMATIIGIIGGGGIGSMLIQYNQQSRWSEVGCILLVIAAVVWIMDLASAHLREALK